MSNAKLLIVLGSILKASEEQKRRHTLEPLPDQTQETRFYKRNFNALI